MPTRLENYREAAVVRAYSLVAWMPTRIGVYLRRAVVRCGAAEAGSGLQLDTGIRITGWSNISFGENVSMMRFGALHAHDGRLRIGNNVSINTNCCIAPANGGRVEIGDNVLIAQNVVIRAADHRHDDVDRPIISQGHVGGEIFIGEGAWICANAVITKDVRIGANAIVGAGAVVTEDVAPFAIVGGVPARLIRSRLAANAVSK
jgi:galactoside O-acetyltransferase